MSGARAIASRRAALIGALAFVVFATGAALCLGPASLTPGDVWETLVGEGGDAGQRIVLEMRLPRVILGLFVGAALSLAGVLLQALLRNDLAEPYLVGVGPGAFLGVTVAALLAAGTTVAGFWAREAFALGGAVLVSALIFTFARRGGRLSGPNLLLGGVALGAFVSSVATAVLYVAVEDWHAVVYWLLGNLRSGGPGDALLVSGALLAAALVSLLRARDLDALALGEESAWIVGVDVRRLVLGLGFVACVLASVAVAAAGLIGFVGLLVPHLARRMVGPAHRALIPMAMALGAGLLVLADGLARVVSPPLEIPVGVVTAAIGAPFLTWLLLRSAAR